MLVCKVLKGQVDRLKVEIDINNFLSSMPLELEDVIVCQVVRGGNKIVTTIIYKAK